MNEEKPSLDPTRLIIGICTAVLLVLGGGVGGVKLSSNNAETATADSLAVVREVQAQNRIYYEQQFRALTTRLDKLEDKLDRLVEKSANSNSTSTRR